MLSGQTDRPTEIERITGGHLLNYTRQGSLYWLNSLSQEVIEDKLRKLAAEQTLVDTKQTRKGR